MKDIFDKCEFGNLNLKSRIIRTGIWETQIDEEGFLDAEVYERYEKIAKSGVGLINSEMFVLDSKDRFGKYCYNLNHRNFIKDYKKITEIAHSHDVPILGQLAFFYYNERINQQVEPNDLSIEGIRHLQTDVIIALKKLLFAGFDGMQLNMGNNFYLSKFTNPYFNQRNDDYGGNTFNRMRIILEILKAIKNNYDAHINCRINPTDVRKGGVTLEESIEMAKLLDEFGADSIQITARTISYAEEDDRNPFIKYVNELVDAVDIPVVLGGNLRDSKTMNTILNNNNVDFLSLSKPFTAQPDFLKDWQNGGGVSICQDCKNCYSKKTSTCFKY